MSFLSPDRDVGLLHMPTFLSIFGLRTATFSGSFCYATIMSLYSSDRGIEAVSGWGTNAPAI
jgi:hypothetical protein